ILLGSIERGERVVVPHVPADAFARRDRMREMIHVAIRVIQRLVPEPFPRHDLRILGEQPPEGDKCAVRRPRVARCTYPARNLGISRFRTLGVEALCFPCRDAILTKPRDPAAGASSAMIRDDRVAEWTLSLAAPHETIDVVRAQVVLDHAKPERARVRVA